MNLKLENQIKGKIIIFNPNIAERDGLNLENICEDKINNLE